MFTLLSSQGSGAVKESWVDGTEWYRIYADGWIEQGGYISSSRQTQNDWCLRGTVLDNYSTQVILHKNYETTGYTVTITPVGRMASPGVYAISNNSFKAELVITGGDEVRDSYISSGPFYWRACGY